MGIQTWRLRFAAPGAKIALQYQTISLYLDGQLYGHALLDMSIDFTATKEKVYNLLAAMFNSVNLRVNLQYSNMEKSDSIFLKEDSRIFIMGQTLGNILIENQQKNSIQANSQVVISSHPCEILTNPLMKRQVWLDLQKFKAITI